MTSVVVVEVGCGPGRVVVDFGRGPGPGAPGVSTCPANAETASVRLRVMAALTRRKVFTFGGLLREMQDFFINLDEREFSCKSAGDLVRFAGVLFSLRYKWKRLS